MPKSRPFLYWTGGLLLCLLLLSGRYDWRASYDSSLLGYVCSAFFLVILLPVFHYTLRHYVDSRPTVLASTLGLGALLSLPYRWLGLDRYSINPTFPIDLDTPPLPMPGYDWFPDAFRNLPAIPGEAALFLALAGIGVLVAWRLVQRLPASRKFVWGGLGLYCLILLQTWLHLSLRSPLTYAGSLVGPSPWPIYFLFPGGQGGVNGDYPVHRTMENLFMGMPAHLLELERSFYYYLTSQFSYFVNPYYVSLVLNIIIWSCSVLCGFAFVGRVWDRRAAVFMAFLIATGSGFIYYVAQPMSYLAGFALCMILIWFFQDLVIDSHVGSSGPVLFGLLLGLGSLVYEGLVPLYLFIVGYGMAERVGWRRLGAAVGLGLLVFIGYEAIVAYGLNQSADPYPYVVPNVHLGVRLSLILNGSIDHIYLLLTQLAVLFWGGMSNVFLVLPLWFAVLGLALVRRSSRMLLVLLLLLMPLSLTMAFHFAGVTTSDNSYAVASWPRFLYVGYVGVYILDALLLRRLSLGIGTGSLERRQWLGGALAGVLVASIFVMNNIDVWGYQAPYYLFGFLTPTLTIIP